MASWAKPGVKCICVDAYPGWMKKDTGLELGREYIVDAVIPPDDTWTCNRHTVGLKIVGLESSSRFGFCADRFRPLITKTQEQDIGMFLRIANDTPFHVMIDDETNA